MGGQRLQDGRSSRRRETRTAAIAKSTPGTVPTKGHPHLPQWWHDSRSPVPDFGDSGGSLLIAARPAEDVVALPVIPGK